MNKLRLAVTWECHRRCDGCCNNDWDLAAIPTVTNYEDFDEVLLTGGEPFLLGQHLFDVIYEIRAKSNARVFIYTALPRVFGMDYLLNIIHCSDGLTVTLHDNSDVPWFLRINDFLMREFGRHLRKSMRLNIFEGVHIPTRNDLQIWDIKDKMRWQKDCPLPSGEVFGVYQGMAKLDRLRAAIGYQ